MKLRQFFYLLPNILSAFFSGSETVKYPQETTLLTERFRGSVRMREQHCVGCSLCVRDCPTNALEMVKKSKDEFRLLYHRDRCAYCGQCELSCRYDAIYLDNEYDAPSASRSSFLVTLVDRILE